MEMLTTHATPLLTALQQLGPHDHLCSIYESREEHFAVAIPFVGIGLDRGEKCVYIADDGTEAVVRDALSAEGIDVERATATGSLMLANKEAAYLKHGIFDPDWMFTFWADATAEAMSQGFSALRVTGDTEWVLRGATGLERWMEYESRLTHMLAHHNCFALCQYNRQLFPTELILDVIRTHPVVIYCGVVCRNMYYVPPDELLGTNQAEQEVDRLLTNIREREKIEYRLRRQSNDLRRSEACLSEGQRISHTGSWAWNPSSREMFSSIEHFRILGIEASGPLTSPDLLFEVVHPADRPDVRQTMEQAIERRREVDLDYRIVRPDGTIRYVHSLARPVVDDSGTLLEYVGTLVDITERRRADEALLDSEARFRQIADSVRRLANRLMLAQDEERRRIARMLHETTAQDLAGLKMLLARLNRTSDRLSGDERQALAESLSLADQSMSQIRTLSYLLHPPFLDETGLLSALRWYAAGFGDRSGIKVELELPESFERMPLDVETALFRIVQESLINIHRHSGSQTARIRLQCDAERLVLEIEDRGRGIPTASLKRITSRGGVAGVGIAGMSERIEQLGGHLEVTSSDRGQTGTTVRVRLPLVKSTSPMPFTTDDAW